MYNIPTLAPTTFINRSTSKHLADFCPNVLINSPMIVLHYAIVPIPLFSWYCEATREVTFLTPVYSNLFRYLPKF